MEYSEKKNSQKPFDVGFRKVAAVAVRDQP